MFPRISSRARDAAAHGHSSHRLAHGVYTADARVLARIFAQAVAAHVCVRTVDVTSANGHAVLATAAFVVQALFVFLTRNLAGHMLAHHSGSALVLLLAGQRDSSAESHRVPGQSRWTAAHPAVLVGLANRVRATRVWSVAWISALVSDASLVVSALTVASTTDHADGIATELAFGAVAIASDVTSPHGAFLVDAAVAIRAADGKAASECAHHSFRTCVARAALWMDSDAASIRRRVGYIALWTTALCTVARHAAQRVWTTSSACLTDISTLPLNACHVRCAV